MKKSAIIVLILVMCINFISPFDFPNITESFNFPGEPLTIVNSVNQSNISEFLNTNIGLIGDMNDTQFSNTAGTLSILELWCRLTGCSMLGNINMNLNDLFNATWVNASFFDGDGRFLTSIGESATTKTTRNAVYKDTIDGKKCQCVYISGATGDKPEVMLCNNQGHFSSHIWGILGEDATFDDEVFVRLLGDVTKDGNPDDCDTSAFAEGCNLHITEEAGNLSCDVPQNGSHIHAGITSKSNSQTGIVETVPQPYIHDLSGTLENELILRCGGENFSFISIQDYNRNVLGTFNCSNNLFNWTGDYYSNGTITLEGDDVGITIYDLDNQNAFIQIGRKAGESLKITSTDNDAIFLYTQDQDENAGHEVRFDMEGAQNMSLAEYTWLFEGVGYMKLMKSVFSISPISNLDGIFIGEKGEVRNAITEGLMIYRNYTNGDRREGVIGMENNGNMIVSIEMIENNSGDIGEEILFRVEDSDKMILNGSGLWLADDLTVQNITADNIQSTTLNLTSINQNEIVYSDGNSLVGDSNFTFDGNGNVIISDNLIVNNGSLRKLHIGYSTTQKQFPGIWNLNDGTPSLTNYRMIFAGTSTEFNAPAGGSVGFSLGNIPYIQIDGKIQFNPNFNDLDQKFYDDVAEAFRIDAGLRQVWISNDAVSLCHGSSQDVCSRMDGSNYNITNEVGSIPFNFNSFSEYNFDNDTEIQSDLNQINGNATINLPYGQMHFHNDSVANVTIIGSANTWYNISALGGVQEESEQLLNGFTYIGGDTGTLTTQIAGIYDIGWYLSATGSVNNKYHIGLAVNNVVTFLGEQHFRIGTGGDIVPISAPKVLIALNVGDRINLQVENEDAANDLNVLSIGVTATRTAN